MKSCPRLPNLDLADRAASLPALPAGPRARTTVNFAVAGLGLPVRRSRRAARLGGMAAGVTLLLAAGFAPGALAQQWVPSTGGFINGGSEGIMSPQGKNPATGDIVAIAPVPGNPSILYVAGVNGGVWKTTNATDPTPNWTPLTDQALPNTTLNSIAISPLDSNVIFVGSGRVSSLASDGGLPFGVGRSRDGGATWSVSRDLAGKSVRSIVPTNSGDGSTQVVLAGVTDRGGPAIPLPDKGYDAKPKAVGSLRAASALAVASVPPSGVYRSTDGGDTFTLVPAVNGIPSDNVTDLVGDPGVASRFYAAVQGTVYVSNDYGANWTGASGAGFNVITGARVLLSVSNAAGNGGVVYAMVIGTDLGLNNVYSSANQGGTWTALGVPTPPIFAGNQGGSNGAIAADPADAGVVYISGDSQGRLRDAQGNAIRPNQNGTNTFSGNLFRNVGNSWQNIVGNGNGGGANGTSPHPDSRSLAFDAQSNLVYSCDGGVYKLNNPNGTTQNATPGDNGGTRTWSSLNSNLAVTETHAAAYDAFSRVAFGGCQDTGSIFQLQAGSTPSREFFGGDGGVVDVDAKQDVHPNTSIRYFCTQTLGNFRRRSYDVQNKDVTTDVIKLNIISGPGSTQTLKGFETNLPFYTPYALNRANPRRMLIGGTMGIYESTDMGDTLTNLIPAPGLGGSVGGGTGDKPISYGGMNGGDVPNEGAFFVGAGAKLYHRVSDTDSRGVFIVPDYPGTVRIRSVVTNPRNVTHVFVVDENANIFGSFDDGLTWTGLTSNLLTLCPNPRTIEFFSADSRPRDAVLLVGGENGVFQMRRPEVAGATWTAVSSGLPRVLVDDLRYDYTNNVLVAGTLGRGIWTLSGFLPGGTTVPPLPIPAPMSALTPNVGNSYYPAVRAVPAPMPHASK